MIAPARRQQGIYFDLPMSDYLAEPAYSNSFLKRLHSDAEECKLWQDGVITDVSTAAQYFGSRLHNRRLLNLVDYVIEPATYTVGALRCPKCGSITEAKTCRRCSVPREEVVIDKDWDNHAECCQEWYALQTKPIVSRIDAADLDACTEALRTDPRCAFLFADGKPEVSVFFEYGGLPFKARFDWLGKGYCLDLKTTTDVSTWAFGKEIANRGYHRQAALYWKAAAIIDVPFTDFYFVAISRPDRKTNTPPRINVRKLKPEAMEQGLREVDRDVELLRECLASGEWPGPSGPGSDIHEIDIPHYAYDPEPELTGAIDA